MKILQRRIQHLERLGSEQRRRLTEIASSEVGQLTEQDLWQYLAACLGRPVAQLRALSDEALEQIADAAFERKTCSPAQAPRPHTESGPTIERPAAALTSGSAASALLRHRRARNKIRTYFPDTGPLRRELYPKHLQFFAAGKQHRERCFIAGNRTGKTEAGAYETTLHLTGDYPEWWQGRRFDRPINAWAAGDTHQTVREILQEKLLGRVGEYGTGMIPGKALHRVTRRQGLADAVDQIFVRHVSGGESMLRLKSYEEGRESFQGAGLDLVWLDEEPSRSIYTECMVRLMVSRGCMIVTFTPLKGVTDLVQYFLPNLC